MGFEYAGGELVPFFALASEKLIEFPQKTIDAFLKRIYLRIPALQGGVDKEMWRETYNQFTDAIKTGFGEVEWGKPDWMLNQNLKYNAATFAAFKNHAETKEIQKLLFDGDKVRKWEDFRDKALTISDTYNKRWLQTEYNHATQSSRIARKWQDAVGDADLYPNLKYVTAGDERVRHSHRDLNGAIYPINDPFWNTYTPPNGWGCRCSIRPTDQPAKNASGLPEIPTGFDNNPGQSGMLFTKDLAYFKGASKAEKAYLENVVGKLVRKPEDVKKHWEKYHAYGEEWEKAGFNYDNGGYNVYHQKHQFDPKTGIYEKNTTELLVNQGHQIELLDEKTGSKQFDTYFMGKPTDIKVVFSEAKIVTRGGEAAKQGANNVIFYLTKDIPKKYLYSRFRNLYNTHDKITDIWYVKDGELHNYKK